MGSSVCHVRRRVGHRGFATVAAYAHVGSGGTVRGVPPPSERAVDTPRQRREAQPEQQQQQQGDQSAIWKTDRIGVAQKVTILRFRCK